MAEATTAAKKKTAKVAAPTKVEGTLYQVQRVFDGGVRAAIAVGERPDAPARSAAELGLELWEDVAVIETARGGEHACKLAAAKLGGGEKDPKPGRFRAFPLRSDSQLDVQAQQQTVVTYSKPAPKPTGAPAQTNGGT